MKKFIPLFGLLTALVIVIGYAWALTNPSSFTMTQYTSTKVIVTIGGIDTSKVDTIAVCNGTAADSTSVVKILAYNDSTRALILTSATAVRDTITGLTPGTTYIWRSYVDSSGTVAYSIRDTVSTKYVALEAPVGKDNIMYGNDIAKANSWPPLYLYNTSYSIKTSTGIDSTLVYNHWTNSGMTISTSGYGASDSSKVMIYLYAGYTDGSTKWAFTPIDSTNVSAKGTKLKAWTINAGAEHYYFRLQGYAGNGNGTTITMRQYRYR